MSYQALAKALAGGASRLVTSLIAAATHPFQIINAIRARFKGMNMGEVSQVYWEGWNAWNAAQELMAAPPDQAPPLDTIPENPFLGAGQQAPERFRYDVRSTYRLPGEAFNRTASLSFTSASELTLGDLQNAYEDWLDALQGSYPVGGWGVTAPGAMSIGFTLLGIEKRF